MSTGKRAAIYSRDGEGAAADWREERGMLVLIPSRALTRLMNAALRREIEVVLVHSLDRLADERRPLLAILRALTATGVSVESVAEDAEFTTEKATIRHPFYATVHADLVTEWNQGTEVGYRVEGESR